MNRLMRSVTAVLLAAALSGCAMMYTHRLYEGPAREPVEIARITAPSSVELLSADGQGLPPVTFLPVRGQVLELLPGSHEIVARYAVIYDLAGDEHDTFRSDAVTLKVDAEAGRTYRIMHKDIPPAEIERHGSYVKLWIEKSEEADEESVMMPSPAPPGPEDAGDEPAATTEPDVDPDNLLKFWWEKASDEERKAFLESIEQN